MFLILFSSIHAKDVIWDFGGIIFHPDKFGVGQQVGLKYFLLYMVMDLKSPNIQSHLFKFLDTVMSDDKRFGAVGTGDGATLPTIMRHWQAGTLSSSDIIKMTDEHIKKMDKIGYFESHYERELIQRVIHAMFDPKILARNVYPVEAGVELLKKCAAAKNPDGSKKNRNFGWSNWDPSSYKYFKKIYPKIFELFDGEFVSGNNHVVKPDKEFYELGIAKFGLNPQNSLLIDDQEVNAKSARECKIGTLVLKNWDYGQLERELRLCGVL